MSLGGNIRLHAYLAQAGIASRRKAETLILARRVRVNGVIVDKVGTAIDPQRDRVDFDGRRVVAQTHRWIVLNKPEATVCTADDPEGRTTVLDLIARKHRERLYPVGRLDYRTQGVLLLTNDGQLAHRLMHPRYRVARVYHVKVDAQVVDQTQLQRLRDGVDIEGAGRLSAAEVRRLDSPGERAWLSMTLHQGINHQIHRMLGALGLRVLKLRRVSFAGLSADGLKPGAYRRLGQAEVNDLRNLVGLSAETMR